MNRKQSPGGTPVSIVVESEDYKSIFCTKDEQSVRYEGIQGIT